MKMTLIVLLSSIISIAIQAQSVKTRTEPGVDLTAYETFTVIKGEFMTPRDQRRISEETLFQSIKKAVIKEMELRGYKYLEDSSAHLRVSYVAGSYNMLSSGVTGPLGQAPASNAAEMNQSRSWSNTTREGILVLDIINSANKKQLWKAEGSNLDLESVDYAHTLDAVIFKAFKKFPNKLKKKKK